MGIEADAILRVLLVFVRVGGLLMAAPFFSRPFVPVQVKVMLAVLLAFILVGYASGPLPAHAGHPVGFAVALLVEATTGLLLGFAAGLVVQAVQMAGEVIGFQMSLSLAGVYSPVDGTTSNPVGQLLSLAFLLLFVLLDGPHHLIRALAASFEVVPLGGAHIAAGGALLLGWMGEFFATALRLAAPFMVTLLLLDVALGIFARVVPQADLFALSLPVKLMAGLSLCWVFVQGFVALSPALVDGMVSDLAQLITALAS